MKKPNAELFRLLRLAIRYPGWHPCGPDATRHMVRGQQLGFFDVERRKSVVSPNRFRLTLSMTQRFDLCTSCKRPFGEHYDQQCPAQDTTFTSETETAHEA
jgi:hypothetical protein